MKTSQRPISANGEDTLMSSPEASLANLFPTQGREAVQEMTATSGRRCSERYRKSGPLGSLVRTLVASPLWWKEGYSLTWERKALYSERVTEFTDTPSGNVSPSNASAKTLRISDTKSNRSLFRLVPAMLPIDETASSFLPMLQTPGVVMPEQTPEVMRARSERHNYGNGTKYNGLASQIKYDPTFKGLLPTPMVIQGGACPVTEGKRTYHMDKKGGGFSAQLHDLAASGLLPTPIAGDWKGQVKGEGKGQETMLCGIVEREAKKLLPTPTARDEKNPSSPDGKRIARKVEQRYTIELNDMASMGMLPTPHAGIYKTAGGSEEYWEKRIEKGHQMDLAMAVYDSLKDSPQAKDGNIFRLSPLFTEEMMGFPLMWTTYPFLSQSGEPNPSRPTEMR